MESELRPAIHAWLQQVAPNSVSVLKLAGDASARKYFRVFQEVKSAILMSWEPFKASEYSFLSVQRHFYDCGIRVPKILGINEELGCLLIEDLGDLTLENKFWENANPVSSRDYYHQTLEQLIRVHDIATHSKADSSALTTRFDSAKFLWELNFTREHLLEGLLKLPLNDTTSRLMHTCFTEVASSLESEAKVVCHRDFHSRNVMIYQNQAYIIDFQDARLGPVQYDLVSLFKDSYVDISPDYERELLGFYLENSRVKKERNFSVEEFDRIYNLQVIQRCFKACGSFASFMNLRKDKRYLKYLPKTLKTVSKSLEYFPEYQILSKVLTDSGALEINFETLQ